MSLIRFLSSGSRGLTKGPTPMGRYRLPDGRLIPSFGNGTNPFQTKATKDLPPQVESSSAAGLTARAASTQAAPPSLAPSPFGDAEIKPTPRVNGTSRVAKGLGAVRVSIVALKVMSLKGIAALRRTGSTLRAKIRRPQFKFALATSSKPQISGAVQGELSLERVRVVRNDLSDTDYEVVSAETLTASPIKKMPRTVAVQTNPRPLGRLAERLFSHKVS